MKQKVLIYCVAFLLLVMEAVLLLAFFVTGSKLAIVGTGILGFIVFALTADKESCD